MVFELIMMIDSCAQVRTPSATFTNDMKKKSNVNIKWMKAACGRT